MKKLLVVLLSAVLLTGLVACGEKTSTYKVGFGTETTVSATDGQYANAGKKVFEASVVYAGIVVDKDGKIVKLYLDEAQNQALIVNGALENVNTSKPTKKALKEDYNMGPVSGIGKEWYEQIAALETYAVGKKVTDIAALALDAEGVATDEEVKAGITISLTDIIKAIVKAGDNLTEVKGAVKIGLASISNVGLSYGTPQINTTMAMIAVDKDGKLVYNYVDVAQHSALVDKNDPTKVSAREDTRSKKEKKEDYNMAPVSPIGKEWYEQQQALEAYSLGKTVSEYLQLAVDGEGNVTDETVKASVTITVTDYLKAVELAGKDLFDIK